MNKYVFLTLMFCLGHLDIVKADNVDLDGLDNVIYVASCSVEAGTQATLSVCMKSTATIRGFQFNLYLPDGVTAVKNSKNKIQVSLTPERLDEDDDHTLSASEQGDGSILVLCGSEFPENFKGSEGEIATMKVDIEHSILCGDYPMILRNVKLTETDISKYYITPEVITTLTITEPQNTLLVLDENSTEVPAAAEGVNVRVKRSIKANEWSTICLPFAVTEAQAKEAFGSDVQIADFTGYETEEDDDGNIVGIKVSFEDVDAIEANHPYIIRVTEPVSEFTIDGVDLVPEDEPTVAAVKHTKKQWSEMIGTYVPMTLDSQMLFLSENKFWYSAGKTSMKGYRAYFDFYDVLTDVEDAYSSRISFSFNGSATGAEAVRGEASVADGPLYDLMGRKVAEGKRPAGRLPKGIYVSSGKKVVVK